MEIPFFTPLDQSLFDGRIVQISGGVSSQLAHLVNKQILSMAAADAKKPIYLFINSPGGEITSGFSIYDTARFVEPEVTTVAVGMAASMGSLIALAAPPERRLAFPNAKFLIHQPLIGGVIQGSASDIESPPATRSTSSTPPRPDARSRRSNRPPTATTGWMSTRPKSSA